MKVKIGTITGTVISWSAPSTVFGADIASGEGYDFPSIIKDSNGYCWVAARYYAGPTGSAERIARSSTPDCTTWDDYIDLIPWRADGYNITRTGGLVVGGCGMDMGFHVVYSLGRVLWPKGFKVNGIGRNGDISGHDKDGGYRLVHQWL